MGIRVVHKGNFNKTERFFNRMRHREYLNILAKYGEEGVRVLSDNTPADTGKTASSWEYGIEQSDGKTTLFWTNSNENEGTSIAILLIYGHAGMNGSYVQGIDFVSPAIQPVFKQIANEAWREIRR